MNVSKEVMEMFSLMGQEANMSFDGLSLEQVRAIYASLGVTLGGQAEDMEAIIDITVPIGKDLPARLYKPHQMVLNSKNRAPVLIYVHGGGWTIGSIESHDKVCRHIAHESKYMVLSVDYSLTPENPMPEGPNDVIDLLKYIYTNGSVWGIDTSNIAIGGDSAGASISAVASIAARNENIPLKGVVLFYPSTDLRKNGLYKSHTENAMNQPLTYENYTWFHNYAIQNEEQAEDWKASPIAAPSLKGIAPNLIFIGGADILHDEGRMYANRLIDEGVEVILHNFPGMVHGFIEMYGALPSARRAIKETSAFLNYCFRNLDL